MSSEMQTAGMGHNNPPEPTPYEAVTAKIEGLFTEATGWLDGAPVDTAGLASGVEKLESMLKAAIKEAEEARKAEAKVFDDGKAEVQSRYNLLIGETKSVTGKAILALDACKKALLPWRTKVQAEKDAAAKKAREEAEAKQAELRRQQAEADQSNLAEQERLSKLADETQKAERAAKSAEKVTTYKTGLRTIYKGQIIPGQLDTVLMHISMNDEDTVLAWCQGWIDRAVRDAGQNAASMIIPGVEITSFKESK